MNATLTTLTTLPRPRRIWLARAGWLAVFLLVGSMFAASLPRAVNDIYYYDFEVLQVRALADTFFGSYRGFVNYIFGLRLMAVAAFWATALYIAWRKFDDSMVLFASATLLLMSYAFAFRIDPEMWRYPEFLLGVLPGVRWLVPIFPPLTFGLLLYVFPDGRFVPARMRWLLLFIIGLGWVAFMNMVYGVVFSDDVAFYVAFAIFMVYFCGGLLSQVVRYHRADTAARRQMRYVVLSLTLLFLLFVFGNIFRNDLLTSSWAYLIYLHLTLIVVAFVPVAIGLSVVRYRLWQMDRLLQRALIYGALSLVVLLIYVLTVGGLSLLFQTQANVAMAGLATGLVAVAIQPLRRELQRWVNRFLYGAWDDPFAVLATLGRQLEHTTTPAAGLTALAETVATSLQLPYVGLLAGDDVVAEAGDRPVGHLSHYPLTYQGEAVGQLVVAARSGESGFSETEARLLRNIARQAGGAVYAAQVTAQLQRSREKLVSLREEERRRLRRDLHDGLGPGLATLAIRAGAAENFLAADPARAGRIMQDIRADAETMVTEIRRLVDELRPAALDQLGLLPALRAFADKQVGSVRFTIHADTTLPHLPAAVEVAAYRIAVEAMTNAVRHAGATTGAVRVGVNGGLHLEIEDNGSGIPAGADPGVGLAAMRERAEELGGRFQLRSGPGQGTRIAVTLPLTVTV